MTVQEGLEEFLFQKKLAGLSPNTINAYQNMISIFIGFIGPNLPVESLSMEIVRKYISMTLDRSVSISTKSSYIRNMKIFLRWLDDESGLSFDCRKIKVPKSRRRHVHIMTDSEIECLFSSVTSAIPWITARDRAILALMLDSGIRQGEVCNLKKCDIDYERMIMKVTGKGAKERMVALGVASGEFLAHYLSICPFQSDYVFLGRLGAPITTNTVKVFVNRLKHKLGFDFSSHKLRHNFATNYCIDSIRATGNSNVYDLSILLGHESVETTRIYEHFAHELLVLENRNSHLDRVLKKC